MPKKKITVIGAGFAGLAAAWHLQHSGQQVIVLQSPQHPSASSIAAGLVHYFTGARSPLNWRGEEALLATQSLLSIASKALGTSVVLAKGLYRPALTDQQKIDFKACAETYPDNQWLPRCPIPGVADTPCLWIPHALSIDTRAYLEGLRLACVQSGVLFKTGKVEDVRGSTVLAIGPSIGHYLATPHTLIKGQLLQLAWPSELPPLPHPVNSRAYIVMDRDHQSCWAGATYERNFKDGTPDLIAAKNALLPKIAETIPLLAKAPILACEAGIRVSVPGRLPQIIYQEPERWFITGLGSKGLLYHALIAQDLVKRLSP